MRPQLVIFDCDGVLVDTEAAANKRMAEIFSDLGHAMSANECRTIFQGRTMEGVCETFAELAGLSFDPGLPAYLRSEVEKVLAVTTEPVPGAVDLVQRVRREGLPYCVASSGSVPKMRITLGRIGLLPLLEGLLFSAQDIGRGKPHPDVFLAAAEAMGSRCEDAVIIEDSLSGVMAGIAAGARVIGYAGDPFTDAERLAAAGAEIVHDMADIPARIGLEDL